MARTYDIETVVVPSNNAGPLWHGILDAGLLRRGKASRNFVSVCPKGYRDEDTDTGWYRRVTIPATATGIAHALRCACWDGEHPLDAPSEMSGAIAWARNIAPNLFESLDVLSNAELEEIERLNQCELDDAEGEKS